MVKDNDQTGDDYSALNEVLKRYPAIKIIKTKGSPPDYYEIEYSLTGYSLESDGSVTRAQTHLITLTLPFGYPHFPPSVKPLTSIFHPDIDPDAIRIADYWESNKSLPELVVYIGRMICGEIYNVEAPFNLKAAEWYVDHLEELPMDTLHEFEEETETGREGAEEPTHGEGPPPLPGAVLQKEAGGGPEASEATVATESSLALSLEREEEPPEDEFAKLSLRDVKKLLARRQIFKANRHLHDLIDEINQEEVNEITDTIGASIDQANQLHKEIERYENTGKLREAKVALDQLSQIASDFPDISELKTRIKDSLALSTSLKFQEKSRRDTVSMVEEDEDAEEMEDFQQVGAAAATHPDATPKPAFRFPALPKQLPDLPYRTIFITTAIAVLLYSGGKLYLADKNNLDQAFRAWQEAGLQLRQNEYQEAKANAENALQLVDKVFLLKSEKKILRQSIDQLLTSKELVEGTKGKVFYNGRYIDINLAAALRKFEATLVNANELLDQGKREEALAKFQSALKQAKDNSLEGDVNKIQQKIHQLTLENTLLDAQKAEQKKEWNSAADIYSKALELAHGLSDQENTSSITRRLAAAQFRKELNQSKETFAESQWKETVQILEDAEKLLENNPSLISGREKEEVSKLRVNAQLYHILSAARQAYDTRDWDKAIEEYEKGIALLKKEKEGFSADYRDSIAKIRRTLLMVKISQQLSNASRLAEKKELPEALTHYQDVVRLIKSSDFTTNENLQSILENTQAQIETISDQIVINDRINWLTENFESIFRTYYPSSKSSILSHPRVVFVKTIGDIMVFNMSCVEKNQGRTFRLELDYQYSNKTNSWSIYTGH